MTQSNSVSQPRSSVQSKLPCYRWIEGNCHRGDKCRYKHDPEPQRKFAEEMRVRESVRLKRDLERQEREAERKVMTEKRAAALEARKLEQLARKQASINTEAAVEIQRVAQRKFAEEMRLRESVRLKRDLERQEREAERKVMGENRAAALKARKLEQLARKQALINTEAAVEIQRVVLGSSLVTCATGLEIRGIISGFDSCQVKISRLPRDAKEEEIIQLFSQQGVDSSEYFLRNITQNVDDDTLEAEVVTTTEIGENITFALHKLPFRSRRLRCETIGNASPDGMGSSNKDISNVLTISWRAPTASMIAIYDTMDQVEWAIRTKHQTVFDRSRLKVEMNTPPTGWALRYYVASSVKVTGLPAEADPEEVREYLVCRFVKPIKSNIYNLNESLYDLKNHLCNLLSGGYRSFEIISRGPDNQGYVKVQAKFESWDHAKAALNSLDGKRLKDTYPPYTLKLPLPLCYNTGILLAQYHSQKPRWDNLVKDTEESKEANLRIQAGDYKVFLKVRGEDQKAVGALKVRVENIVKGEKLDASYWHRSFCSPEGRKFLQNLYTIAGVHVRPEWKLHSLRLYGDGSKRARALELIKAEVERLNFNEWTVMLKRQSVGFFVRKGLDVLKEELGENAVSLNLSSTPCTLIITGGEAARHAVSRLMDEAVSEFDLIAKTEITEVCPICYDQVTLPIELGCGHNYCSPCFRHYLRTAPDTKSFPLICIGDEDKCKVPIPLPIIQRFLHPPQFNHLIEVAVLSYIDKNPEKFRYCSTPDCSQIYICSTTQTFRQCPSCMVSVCTHCHEDAHAGMTCAQRKRHKDAQSAEEERLTQEWVDNNGVKRCPRCSIWIQKSEGCNHMTCACGAHICWKCMGVFGRDDIYPHM
ncbi:hypothetical protein M422DRAFT_209809, partial [Sphaerobolus stellatus SS14]